jgi:hypothetical protein
VIDDASLRTSPRQCSYCHRSPWRLLFITVLCFGLVFGTGATRAQDVAVPAALQSRLLAKVVEYDRNFSDRAGEIVHILIIGRPELPTSMRSAEQMLASLAQIERMGGLPHDEVIVRYRTARELAEECRVRKAAVVYLGPGFREELGSISNALDGVDILSVTGIADYVPEGVVLGFDVISSQPRMLINLAQAKRQNVSFQANVLKLMKVFP